MILDQFLIYLLNGQQIGISLLLFIDLQCQKVPFKMLILAFTTNYKMGQSVADTRQRIFLFGFFYLREDTLRHLTG